MKLDFVTLVVIAVIFSSCSIFRSDSDQSQIEVNGNGCIQREACFHVPFLLFCRLFSSIHAMIVIIIDISSRLIQIGTSSTLSGLDTYQVLMLCPCGSSSVI